jgi:hypothetical protein
MLIAEPMKGMAKVSWSRKISVAWRTELDLGQLCPLGNGEATLMTWVRMHPQKFKNLVLIINFLFLMYT